MAALLDTPRPALPLTPTYEGLDALLGVQSAKEPLQPVGPGSWSVGPADAYTSTRNAFMDRGDVPFRYADNPIGTETTQSMGMPGPTNYAGAIGEFIDPKTGKLTSIGRERLDNPALGLDTGGLGGMAKVVSIPAAHPAWIPTRLITSKRAVAPEEGAAPNIIDMAALRETPDLYKKNVDLFRDYPNVTQSMASRGSTDSVARQLSDHATDNLLAIHDAVPAAIRERSKLWYDGARKITDDWSQEFGLPDHSIAGTIAALSPQKDWFQNVSLARRVLDIYKGGGENFRQGQVFDGAMNDRFNSLSSMQKPATMAQRDLINGRSLNDLDRLDLPPEEKASAKALWVRMYDQANHDPSYRIVSPEGTLGDFAKNLDNVTNGRVGWGSLTEISKAIRSIDAAEDPSALSALMGEKHKVRNFYNNILDPNSARGDITADTHAVAAALFRPLTGNSVEVAHNFGNYAGKDIPGAGGSAITGVQGTYPLYADAYRRAASERGILPREMQSITWEGIRGLFPDTWKVDKNMQAVDAVWDQFRRGKISQPEARRQIIDLTPGGFQPPVWYK